MRRTTPVADPVGFPIVTYGMGDPVRIHMNNEIVHFIPIRAAHTGGDTNIKFEKGERAFHRRFLSQLRLSVH